MDRYLWKLTVPDYLPSEDQVVKAEILQALHFASNYWFGYCTT